MYRSRSGSGDLGYTRMRFLAILIFSSLLVAGAQAQESDARLPERIQFNRDIRPILSDNCMKCHGPNAQARKGNLRLDTQAKGLGELVRSRRVAVPAALVSGGPAAARLAAWPDDGFRHAPPRAAS